MVCIHCLTSIIIPSRNEPYLSKTITDILKKAKGKVEVLVVLDGYWEKPDRIILDDRVSYLHFTHARGMREAINAAVAISRGENIIKTDAHCLFDEGFDDKLHRDYIPDTVFVPRRKRLDPEKWQLIEDGRIPVDYEYLDSSDLHGVRWDEKAIERKDVPVDPIISAQGSCWMMSKDYYNKLNLLDVDAYGPFFLEFQEISFRSWLFGGGVYVDKNTWYAHWHKTEGRGYKLGGQDREIAVAGIQRLVAENREKFNEIINKFKPMPTW